MILSCNLQEAGVGWGRKSDNILEEVGRIDRGGISNKGSRQPYLPEPELEGSLFVFKSDFSFSNF